MINLLRQCERQFRAAQRDKLLQTQSDNPKAFWDEIRNRGPGQKSCNINGVYTEGGSVPHDPNMILSKWKHDFQHLFNPDINVADESFWNSVDELTREWESEFQCCGNVDNDHEPLSESCDTLNQSVTLDEVRRAIEQSKNGKASGVDNVPNEILKNQKLLNPLHKLYQYCFENSVVPDDL